LTGNIRSSGELGMRLLRLAGNRGFRDKLANPQGSRRQAFLLYGSAMGSQTTMGGNFRILRARSCLWRRSYQRNSFGRRAGKINGMIEGCAKVRSKLRMESRITGLFAR